MFKINDAHEINEEFICSTEGKETLPLLKTKGWKGVREKVCKDDVTTNFSLPNSKRLSFSYIVYSYSFFLVKFN